MSSSRLRYLPLGGLGEIGINMWALEWDKKILVVDDLYQRGGLYEYRHGFHWQAIAALAAGAGVAFIGLIVPPLRVLYNYAWFVGFLVSFLAYYALANTTAQPITQAANSD